jgi:eukaryotic-like serine/threonine-protein kinase
VIVARSHDGAAPRRVNEDLASGRTLPQAPPSDRPLFAEGQRVGTGDYRVLRLLAAGGMGQIYEARDPSLERIVALKVAHPGVARDTLLEEGRALAAVRHPGVVTVYGRDREGALDFLVMERLYGVSLHELLQQRQAGGSRLDIDEALDLFTGLAEALGAVHRAGMVHRDLSATNVVVCPGGRVVIIDFGIFSPECTIGVQRIISGTPHYMAPEAIAASATPGAGHLVDLYALGMIAYQLVTGKLPFAGASVTEVLDRQLHAPVPPLTEVRPDVPAELAELVASLVHKDPHQRPNGVEDLLWRLRAIRSRREPRAPGGPFRVLIVDDEADTRMLLERCVRRALPDLEVAGVADGAAALRWVADRPPEVMLLDLDMPGLSGLEVCMALRGTHSCDRTTIVLVSGCARDEDRALLAQLGVRYFLRKDLHLPASLTELILRLRHTR